MRRVGRAAGNETGAPRPSKEQRVYVCEAQLLGDGDERAQAGGGWRVPRRGARVCHGAE
jgi:hypothetical protein